MQEKKNFFLTLKFKVKVNSVSLHVYLHQFEDVEFHPLFTYDLSQHNTLYNEQNVCTLANERTTKPRVTNKKAKQTETTDNNKQRTFVTGANQIFADELQFTSPFTGE